MKKISLTLIVGFAFQVLSAGAGTVTGFVRCDANQNGVLNPNDPGIAGVTVRIVSESGSSFSNSTVTTTNGSFSLTIPAFDPVAYQKDPLSQTYIETLDTNTLPDGSTIVLPQPITNATSIPSYYIDYVGGLTNLEFKSGAGVTTNGNWLIIDPDCQNGGGFGNRCTLSGSGKISANSKKPQHIFGGKIISGKVPTGQWIDADLGAKQRFQSITIQSAVCSTNDNGFHVMDFSGMGMVIPAGGNIAGGTPALFNARAEDHGRRGKGAYYLWVYTSDGTTLLLVSNDPGDPTDVAPVVISAGNLRLK